MKNEKHFGLRISNDLLRRFRFVCEFDGRSANAQILFLIRQHIAAYESQHGKITEADIDKHAE